MNKYVKYTKETDRYKIEYISEGYQHWWTIYYIDTVTGEKGFEIESAGSLEIAVRWFNRYFNNHE